MGHRRDNARHPALTRRRLLGLAGAASVAGLAGCGDDDGPARTPTPPPSGSPVALIVPGYDDPSRWAGQTLRVAAWGGEVQDALRATIWEPFTIATGCVIQELTTDYARLASSIATGQPYADVVLIDEIWGASEAGRAAAETIAAGEVDRERFGDIGPAETMAPAYAYAMVGAFRNAAVERVGEPANWREWWDLDRYAGPRSLPKQALGTFEFALLADGVAPADLYPIEQERALASLRTITDRIGDLWWGDGLEPVSWMSRSRADLTAAWHYRVIAGQQDGRAIDFTWSQGLLVADAWIAAKGGANRAAAVDLIAFSTMPEVQAALARMIPLGPVTPRSFDFLDARAQRRLPTTPAAREALVRLDRDWWAANRTAADARFSCWQSGTGCPGQTPAGSPTP